MDINQLMKRFKDSGQRVVLDDQELRDLLRDCKRWNPDQIKDKIQEWKQRADDLPGDRVDQARLLSSRAEVCDWFLDEPQQDPVLSGGPSGNVGSRTTTTGEKRFYGPGEELEWRSSNLPPDVDPDKVSLGEIVRAQVTGDFSEVNEHTSRAMSSLDSALGGFHLPSPTSERVIRRARADSNIMGIAQIVPMESKSLTMARVSGDPTASWRQEGDDISDSDVQLEEVRFEAQNLGALTRVAAELAEDAEGIADTIERAISEALSKEFDRAAMLGTGDSSDGIVGIENADSVNTRNNGGASISDVDLFIQAVRRDIGGNDGPPPEELSLIAHPNLYSDIALSKDGQGQYLSNNFPPEYAALEKLDSTQLPTTRDDSGQGDSDETICMVGSGTALLLGLRQDIRVEFSRDSRFSQNQIEVKATMRADLNFLQKGQFWTVISQIAV